MRCSMTSYHKLRHPSKLSRIEAGPPADGVSLAIEQDLGENQRAILVF
jgi:hypothetical protein